MEETVAVGVKQESSTEKKDWNEKSTQQQTLFNRSICHARVKTLSQQHPQPPALPSGHTLSGTHTHTHTRARTHTHAHNRTNSYGCAHSLKLSHPHNHTHIYMHTQGCVVDKKIYQVKGGRSVNAAAHAVRGFVRGT